MELEKFQARPDQVLVLYNEDWTKDVDLSSPGQDSKETAEYYQKRHTEPLRDLKPYVLGLKCTHGKKHLNNWFVEEKSQDNRNGLVFKGRDRPPAGGEWARDSRLVEIVTADKDGTVDWDSVRMWCSAAESAEKVAVTPVVSGIPVLKGNRWEYPPIENGKGRCFRFNAHARFSGTLWVYFEVKDKTGAQIRDLKLAYHDRDDFSFSMLGQDGISDDKHFQEDIAIPVKQFLEDPENALPDGTLLKNHILYIAVCHGLPFSVEGVYGIERGTTSNPSDHGDLGSLEQRLQTLYYGWGTQIKPPVISMYMDKGPDSEKGVRNYRITSAMRYPMYGKQWNIFMHPDTYSFLRQEKEPIKDYTIPPFPKQRKQAPDYFVSYGVSRVDGQGPEQAKRLIDYALYASKYLRPEMIHANNHSMDAGKKKNDNNMDQKDIYQGKYWGMADIPALGFEKNPGQQSRGIPFLRFDPDFSNNLFRYLPGGMDQVVDSANGWNGSRDQPIWQQTEQGVTISACGGPAYGGGPHITNATFWDNRILMRYLFRGRDLGECFLLSTIYVNWSTSLLGDPLYHPDLSRTVVDKTPPLVQGKDDIQVSLYPTMGKQSAVITVPVQFSEETPEVALLKAYFRKTGETSEQSVSSSIFSAQPRVVLKGLEADSVYKIRLVLTDPYGNQTDLSRQFGDLTIPVVGVGEKPAQKQAVKRNNSWVFEFLRLPKLSEQGTIQIEFEAGKEGLMPSIDAKGMSVKARNAWPKGLSFRLGGVERHVAINSVLRKGEKVTMIVRWRRYPLTREVLLKANDGSEFTLLADVRTPWENIETPPSIRLIDDEEIKILSASVIDDAEVASDAAMGIELSPLNKDDWVKAQNRP